MILKELEGAMKGGWERGKGGGRVTWGDSLLQVDMFTKEDKKYETLKLHGKR